MPSPRQLYKIRQRAKTRPSPLPWLLAGLTAIFFCVLLASVPGARAESSATAPTGSDPVVSFPCSAHRES